MKKERSDMLIDIAKQQLRKAGWYEGRKIDLTKYEEAYAKIGCELFPAARKFLEEYGNLHFYDKYEALDLEDGYCIKESSTELVYCCSRRDNELEEMVRNLFGQKVLKVGLIDCGNIYIFISEDGRFLLIGMVLVFGQKIPTSFGMSTMVKTMVVQLGMI